MDTVGAAVGAEAEVDGLGFGLGLQEPLPLAACGLVVTGALGTDEPADGRTEEADGADVGFGEDVEVLGCSLGSGMAVAACAGEVDDVDG